MNRFARLLYVELLLVLSTPSLAEPPSWSSEGPYGGWVIRLHRDDSGLWAGTFGGGLYQSIDDGLSWIDRSAGLSGTVVWAMDRADDLLSTFYVGSEDYGIERTDDNSPGWLTLGGGLPRPPFGVRDISVDPLIENFVDAATSVGVFGSYDRGKTFPDSMSWVGGTTMQRLARHPSRPNAIWALADSDLYLSLDRGNNFTTPTDGLPGLSHRDLLLWPSHPDTQWVASLTQGLYRRLGTLPFQKLTLPGNDNARLYDLNISGSHLLMGGERGLYRSSDLGENWTLENGGLNYFLPEIWAILVESEASAPTLELSLGSFREGYLRYSGGPFEPRNDGLLATWVHGLGHDGQEILAATAHGKLFRSRPGGWEDLTFDLDVLQLQDALSLNGRLIVASETGLFRMGDGGAIWVEVSAGPGAVKMDELELSGDGRPFAGGVSGLWSSDNAGDSWRLVDGLIEGPVRALAPFDGGLLVAVRDEALQVVPATGDSARVLDVEGIYGRSYRDMKVSANGVIYLATTTGIDRIVPVSQTLQAESIGEGLPADLLIEAIAYDDENQVVYVGSLDQGVWLSANAGGEWEPFDLGFPNASVEELIISGRWLHAGTAAKGVWKRSLHGNVPILSTQLLAVAELGGIRLRLALPRAFDLQVHLDNELLWSGRADGAWEYFHIGEPSGRRHYRVELFEAGVVVATTGTIIGEELPIMATRLLPASPNPFNPRTLIRFELEREVQLRLSVHDARGRRVAQLVDEERSAGRHEIPWDALDHRGFPLPSGVYHLRLEWEGRVESRPITLLR